MSSDQKSWCAVGDGWVVYWTPSEPFISGSTRVCNALRTALDGKGSMTIAVTGEDVRNSVTEPMAVLLSLEAAGGSQFSVSENAPQIPELPKGVIG